MSYKDFDYNEDEYVDDEIIDFSKYFKKLKSHWKTVLYWAAGAFVVGCLVALGTPHKYTVVSKLAPELSATATNRLSSLSSLVGFSSTMLGTTDAVYPMVYSDVLKSPAFLSDLFDVTVSFKDKGEMAETTLYEYLTEHKSFSVMALPGMAVGAVMGLFEAKEDDVEATDVVDPFEFTKEQSSVVKTIGKSIEAETDKKTLAITIAVTMPDPHVAATLAAAVNSKLKEFVTKYRTDKAKKDCLYFQKLHEEAQRDYYDALTEYSIYSDSHQNITLRSSQIENERLKNEANLKYQLYTSTAQQLQASKAKVQQETPVFAEIITPTVPRKAANSRKKIALAFGFIGVIAGAVWVLWKYIKEE